MAPKTRTVNEDEPSLSDIMKLLKSQGDQLAAITAQVSKVDKIESEVKDLKTLIVALKDENKQLNEQLKVKDKVIDDMAKTVSNLEEKMNNVEQHHRSWGA